MCGERKCTKVYDCVWLEHPGRKKAADKSRARREERAYRFRKAAKVCGVTRVGGNKAEVVTLLGVLDGSVKCMIVVR